MAEELKPCPFCGGKANYAEDDNRFFPYRIVCSKCRIGTQFEAKLGIAIDAWNTRATEANAKLIEATQEFYTLIKQAVKVIHTLKLYSNDEVRNNRHPVVSKTLGDFLTEANQILAQIDGEQEA